MTLLTAASTSRATNDVDLGSIAAIAIIPVLMLVISVLVALRDPGFAGVLATMG